jgi:hypothetical protein
VRSAKGKCPAGPAREIRAAAADNGSPVTILLFEARNRPLRPTEQCVESHPQIRDCQTIREVEEASTMTAHQQDADWSVAEELAQADESALYHHCELNYTPPDSGADRAADSRALIAQLPGGLAAEITSALGAGGTDIRCARDPKPATATSGRPDGLLSGSRRFAPHGLPRLDRGALRGRPCSRRSSDVGRHVPMQAKTPATHRCFQRGSARRRRSRRAVTVSRSSCLDRK